MNINHKLLGVVFFLFVCGGCSSTKPCSDGGDVSWSNPIKGDRVCYQKRQPDGGFVNDGKYFQRYPNGKVAVEGEFSQGKKNGYWYQYDENGNKVSEKYFDHGVEKSIIPPPSK